MNGHRARVARAHRSLPAGTHDVDHALDTLASELARIDPATVTDADRAEVTALIASLERQYPHPRNSGRRPGVR